MRDENLQRIQKISRQQKLRNNFDREDATQENMKDAVVTEDTGNIEIDEDSEVTEQLRQRRRQITECGRHGPYRRYRKLKSYRSFRRTQIGKTKY